MLQSTTLILTSCLLIVNPALAMETAIMDVNSEQYTLHLPQGYCDITDTIEGISGLIYLEKAMKASGEDIVPKIIYNRCDSKASFPWGYIGLRINNDETVTQQQFNTTMASLFEDTRFQEVLEQQINEAGSAAAEVVKENNGIDIDEINFGETIPLAASEWNYHVAMKMQTQVNEKTIVQQAITSVSVLNNHFVYYYNYRLDADLTDLNDLLNSLDEASKYNQSVNH